MKLAQLKHLGFDQSHHIPFTRSFKVRCSQCEALCINGIPTHETGCPHTTYECKGCGAVIKYHGYCRDCKGISSCFEGGVL